MKTLALAMLVPIAIYSDCGITQEASAARAPAQSAAAGAPEKPRTTAQASLASAAGSQARGDLTLTSEGTGVLVRGQLIGLSPGEEHGFHLHQIGQCALPGFTSAGEHFNPTRDQHGGPDSKARHLGDLRNAKADDNGRARIEFTIDGVTLEDKDGGPNQILGKALVVHAMPDDYKTQPSGGSGDRIACGVIR